jgi:poly-gamma-glutamate capsule biosynthesis protein CapA/YwtB (metallophosphatase superfamily)
MPCNKIKVVLICVVFAQSVQAQYKEKLTTIRPLTLASINKLILKKASLDSLYAKDTLSIIGVGDIMMGSNFPSVAYLPPNDGQNLLDEVRPILQSADVTFGNLEGTLLDTGGTRKECKDPNVCYAFRSPTRYGKYLQDAGFDLMSLANNHSGDFGPEGRASSMRTLDTLGIRYAGLLVIPTAIFVKDSIRYGLAAFAPNSGTCDIRNIPEAQRIVEELSKQVDIVIVSFHGGAEGRSHSHVTRKTEMFVGENRGNVYAFAHKMVEAGADIVFGHGPHVTRSVDLYKDRFIIYSMGNFCTYGRFSLTGESGLAPLVNVFINRQGEFLKAEITPIKQVGEGGPIIDTEGKVIKVLQQLLVNDFPEVPLNISNTGLITRRIE